MNALPKLGFSDFFFHKNIDLAQGDLLDMLEGDQEGSLLVMLRASYALVPIIMIGARSIGMAMMGWIAVAVWSTRI